MSSYFDTNDGATDRVETDTEISTENDMERAPLITSMNEGFDDVVDPSCDEVPLSGEPTTTSSCRDDRCSQLETLWEEVTNDAVEFENILFSLHRPTARERLQKLSLGLKLLGSRLKCYEEITLGLQRARAAQCQIIVDDTEDIQDPNSYRLKRSAENNNGTVTEASESCLKRVRLDAPDTISSCIDRRDDTSIRSGPTQTNSQVMDEASMAPLLKPKDKWVIHLLETNEERCPIFFQTNNCPLGADCNRIHVFNAALLLPTICDLQLTNQLVLMYSRADLDKAYSTYRSTILNNSHFGEKIKPDLKQKQWYTCRFTCPVDKTIYYATEIPSSTMIVMKSSQRLHWFESSKDAQASVCTIIIRSLQKRNIVPMSFVPLSCLPRPPASKQLTSRRRYDVTQGVTYGNPAFLTSKVLPIINPWNWMEIDYERRCTLFNCEEVMQLNSNHLQGCPDGRKCRYAHVHFPQSVREQCSPNCLALPYAYRRNFHVTLADDPLWSTNSRFVLKHMHHSSHFGIRSVTDNQHQVWYAVAWKCPVEGVIYYAAGARNGVMNSQNMFLYPSIIDAKLAVCGVILNAFSARGMYGSWDAPTDIGAEARF